MTTDPEFGGPSCEDRQQLYAQMQLSPTACSVIESMVAESGRRPVANAALTNVRVRHNSIKNGKPRVVESHTCELVFAYELEFDPGVIGYYVQVPCRRVLRTTQHGRHHVSTAHLDYLVFRRDGIELIECKQRGWLDKQAALAKTSWHRNGECWDYPPYRDWATEHGLAFRVWVAPEPPGVYLQNLEACYGLLNQPLDVREEAVVGKAVALLDEQPASIAALTDEISGFQPRLALWMLANAVAFGALKSTPINQDERFLLYGSRAQAEQVDATLLKTINAGIAQPSVDDPLLLASSTDIEKARERLARLELIAAGELASTRRMEQLARKVRNAIARGQSPLSACLTKYANSGNRTSRLLPQHEQAIETVIARYWNTGKVERAKDLFFEFEKECEQRGVAPWGRSRLEARRRSESPLRHALNTGGFRAYHAVRSSTDPRTRSMAPLGYGQVLHIDSSDLDVRCAPDLMRFFPAAKAKFYIGLDGATGDTMAHAMIFGAARTDGLALLMREYVKRHGFLPKMIHVDRGPENTSHWMHEFCEGRISLRHSPTAASAWNGIAENAIKQVNEQVAHRLVGSTAPDQKGRKVDGRFKSRSNAKTGFATVLEQFIAFAYDDLPNTPRADGLAPIDKKRQALASFGVMGTPCQWNDDFVIQTSIRLRQSISSNVRRGIRTADGWFASDELLAALRTQKPAQVRSDPGYPEVLYVQIGGRWLKAFHNRVQNMALLSDSEKLFELLLAPIARAKSREDKNVISRARHDRRQLAEAARAGEQDSVPPLQEPVQDSAPDDPGPITWDLPPYEEREDY